MPVGVESLVCLKDDREVVLGDMDFERRLLVVKRAGYRVGDLP